MVQLVMNYLVLGTLNNGVCPLLLFVKNVATFNNISPEGNYCKGKVYSVKIYEDDILVKDYIPVKNNITGEIGLLDIINNVFQVGVTNTAFIAGPEIIDTEENIEGSVE